MLSQSGSGPLPKVSGPEPLTITVWFSFCCFIAKGGGDVTQDGKTKHEIGDGPGPFPGIPSGVSELVEEGRLRRAKYPQVAFKSPADSFPQIQ